MLKPLPLREVALVQLISVKAVSLVSLVCGTETDSTLGAVEALGKGLVSTAGGGISSAPADVNCRDWGDDNGLGGEDNGCEDRCNGDDDGLGVDNAIGFEGEDGCCGWDGDNSVDDANYATSPPLLLF